MAYHNKSAIIMKKLSIIFLLLFSLQSFIHGQSLVLDQLPGLMQLDIHEDAVGSLHVKNTSDAPIFVMVERVTNNLATGHENYMCWDVCYNPDVDESIGALRVLPGEFSDSFKLNFYPNGQPGYSEVTIRFYDRDNPSNAAEYTFQVSAGGVTDVEDSFSPNMGGIGSLYPNPARDYTTLDYELPFGTRRGLVKVYNLVGRQVKQMPLTSLSGSLELNTDNLNAGVYFLFLSADGKEIDSKKLIISK